MPRGKAKWKWSWLNVKKEGVIYLKCKISIELLLHEDVIYMHIAHCVHIIHHDKVL